MFWLSCRTRCSAAMPLVTPEIASEVCKPMASSESGMNEHTKARVRGSARITPVLDRESLHGSTGQ